MPVKNFQHFYSDVYKLNWNFTIAYKIVYIFKIVGEADGANL